MKNSQISFVIPCYRSEKTILNVIEEIDQRMADRTESYEIVLVNDHSPDQVWKVIEEQTQKRADIIAINLAKNFGQHSALLAGYSQCSGEYVISLDDDGQAPLDSLGEMIDTIYEGYDVVYAYYEAIKQNAFRRFGSRMAGLMGNWMLNPPKDLKASSFYIARKFVIEEMLRYNHPYPYLLGLVVRTTHNIGYVQTKHRSRLEGTSGYSFKTLLALWLNGFTAFSVKPLELSTYVGVFMAALGFIYAIITIVRRIIGSITVAGFSSIIAILLILGGMIMVMLGIIGEYIGRIYICINNSPQYVIRDVIDHRDEEDEADC